MISQTLYFDNTPPFRSKYVFPPPSFTFPESCMVSFFFFPSLLPRDPSIQAEERRRNGRRSNERLRGWTVQQPAECARAKCDDICSPRCCRYPANIYSYDNRYIARGLRLIAATGSLFQRCKGERRIDLHGACIRATKSLFNVWVCSWVIRNFGQLLLAPMLHLRRLFVFCKIITNSYVCLSRFSWKWF